MAEKSTQKSMDIQKPSNAKPDNTSRPIIVTNRPILQDPMVKDSSKEPETPENKENVLVSSNKTLTPSKEAEEELKADPEKKQEETATPEKEETTSADIAKPIDSIPEPSASDSAVVDAVVAGIKKPGDTASAQQIEDQEKKRQLAVQVLIDSKKYVVPVGQVSRARHNRNSILLLGIIVAVVIGYLAIDFGLVPVPFELPVHFFNTSLAPA